MKYILIAGLSLTFLLISSSPGLSPVIDDCRSNLLDSTHASETTVPNHACSYSISPSNKWVLEAIYYNSAVDTWRNDSAQIFIFQYCYPSEHIYLSTFYATNPNNMEVRFMSDAASNSTTIGDSWEGGGKEDEVYLMVLNSTLNTASGKQEIFKIDISSITGGLSKTTQQRRPQVLSKTTIYPNPFANAATIEYSIPDEGYVAINIYNAKGELISVLVQEKQSQGKHSIKWNGENNLGNRMAGGMYYFQVISGKFISEKALVKIK